MNQHAQPPAPRGLFVLLILVLLAASCVAPAAPQTISAAAKTAPATAGLRAATSGSHAATAIQAATATSAPEPVATATVSPPPTRSTRIRVTSQAPRSSARIQTLTPVPPSPTPAAGASEAEASIARDAEPLILSGLVHGNKCGHGDVVALDGHWLRATPRIGLHEHNKLELIEYGERVELIDCRLWTNTDAISWVAARTADGKLGWMFLQSDKFYVTIYPIPVAAPAPLALTGIPSGATVAYVPPSDCSGSSPSTGAVATSIGVDFIPVVGDLKGLGEAATGCDLVTGESLGNWRWLGLLGLIGLSEVAVLRHGDDAARGIRLADDLGEGLRFSDEAAYAAARNADEAAALAARNADEAASVAGRNADEATSGAVRHADEAADVARTSGKGGDAARAAAGTAPDAARAGATSADEIIARLSKFDQPCSFSADTPVITDAGWQPIASIRPGDRVLAFDEATGTTGYRLVTGVSAHVDTELVAVWAGNRMVLTTDDHPFYVETGWKAAGNLLPGDGLSTPSGAHVPVEQVTRERGDQVMYNLTVAGAHTYFAGGWLVHNACGKSLRNSLKSDRENPLPWWTDEVEWQAHHVIPREWESLDIIGVAKRGGFNFDGAENGVALPRKAADAKLLDLPYHSGSHADYSDMIRRQLDDIAAEYADGGMTDAAVAERVWHVALTQRATIMRQMVGRVH